MKHTINRNSLLFLVAGLMAIATACGDKATTPTAPGASSLTTGIAPISPATTTRVIKYTDDGFVPKTVTIFHGEVVEFVNQSDQFFWPASNIHPTHEIYSEFDPEQPILPGESWSFIFSRVGEWRYHNHLDPVQTGRVVVEGEAAARTKATSPGTNASREAITVLQRPSSATMGPPICKITSPSSAPIPSTPSSSISVSTGWDMGSWPGQPMRCSTPWTPAIN